MTTMRDAPDAPDAPTRPTPSLGGAGLARLLSRPSALLGRLRWQAAPAERQLIAILTVVPLVAYAFAARLRLMQATLGGDEPAYLVLSQAMQLYHSLDVTQVYANGDYHAFFRGHLDAHTVIGAGGRPEPLHQFGGPLLWLIPFMIWGRAGAQGLMVVVSLLTVVNVYYFLRERGISTRYAFITTMALAIGSPIYVFSSMSFVEPIGTLGMIFAVRALLLERLRPARLVVASVGVAYIPWVHMRFAPIAVSLGVLLLLRVWRDHGRTSGWPYVQVLAPLAISAVLIEVFTISVYGKINPMAPQAIFGVRVFDVPFHEGFVGTLFDRNYGLITNFPVFLLVLPGILLAARRSNNWTNAVLAAVIVPGTVLAVTSTTWWGAYNPAGRYISIFVPLVSYYIAVALQRLDRWWTTCAAVLLALGTYALHLTTDLFAAERFSDWDLQVRGMDRLGGLVGVHFGRFAPSSFLPYQRGLFATWILVTVVVGLVLWLVGRRNRLPDGARVATSSPPARHARRDGGTVPARLRHVLTPTGGWAAAGVAVILAATVPLASWHGPNPPVSSDQLVGAWDSADGGRLVLARDGTFTGSSLPDDVVTATLTGATPYHAADPRRSVAGQWRVDAQGTGVELALARVDANPVEAVGYLRPTKEAGDSVMYLFVKYPDMSVRYAFAKSAS